MGKQLIIIGADFSAVAIGTAKVLDYITATITGTQYTNMAPTGLTVTAYYTAASGGGSSVVTGYTTSPTVWGSTVGQQTMTISYTRGGVTKTTTVTANVQQGGGTVYSITGSITNGSLTGDSSVAAGGSANVTISPSSGYTYPAAVSDITVTGATKGTYNSSTGALTITNATGNVTITAACPSSGAVIKTLAEIQASLKTAQCAKDSTAILNDNPVTTLTSEAVNWTESTSSSTQKILYSTIPLGAGSEVMITVSQGTTSNPSFAVGFVSGSDPFTVATWTNRNWKPDNSSFIVPDIHLWATPSMTAFLAKQTNSQFDTMTATFPPADLMADNGTMKLKTTSTGFEIYVNNALYAQAITSSLGTKAQMTYSTPAYFCFATGTNAHIAITGMTQMNS